ncbi:MAG: EpsI family protein [Acidobacteriia bacterium]|nr:EpsI family protein [Terriglobia bacterium]
MRLLNSKAAIGLTAVLLAEGGLFFATASRPENTPLVAPLAVFPTQIGGWQVAREMEIDKDGLAMYACADLFVAYFQTQRTGAAPHSPKNCLPGSGWEPVETPGKLSIESPGRASPLVVNRYVVARGDQRSVVLYWYQSHSRVIASEFSAKFWLIADSVRFHRSDTALIKVVVPVRDGDSERAVDTAVRFVQAMFPALAKQLPA